MIDYLQQIHGGTGDHVQVRCEFLTKLDHKWTQKVLWLVWMFLKKKKKSFFFIQGLWKGPLIDNDGSSHEMTVKIWSFQSDVWKHHAD